MKTVFKIDEHELLERLRALRSANDGKDIPDADYPIYAQGKQIGYSNGISDAIYVIIELISSEKTIMIGEEE